MECRKEAPFEEDNSIAQLGQALGQSDERWCREIEDLTKPVSHTLAECDKLLRKAIWFGHDLTGAAEQTLIPDCDPSYLWNYFP